MARVAIVGAGIGGLTAALRMARLGHAVTVCEARAGAGGLAGGETWGGLHFDTGPYLLLDLPGLEKAFSWLGLDLRQHVALLRVEDICTVSDGKTPPIHIYGDLRRTAEGLDARWPGAGARYEALVASVARTYGRLNPLLFEANPRAAVWRTPSAWTSLPFLLRPLGEVLSATGLPRAVVEAMGIWAHFVGQPVDEAPSPMAFALLFLHVQGAYYARGGIGTVATALEAEARAAGVEFRFGTRVEEIRCHDGRVVGVGLEGGEALDATVVISNRGGFATHRLVVGAEVPRSERAAEGLVLQSPGACAWLSVQGQPEGSYLRFSRPEVGPCSVLVSPGTIDPDCGRGDAWPARLIAPIRHAEAAALGPEGQERWLDERLAETWWREGRKVEVLARRTPAGWGRQFHLPEGAMNPAMTARFMRQGRLSHKNPDVGGLYLAGSSTHPGQFVAFCAQSGVHAANRADAELR